MLREKLQELGFSQNQTDVYLALIELGQTKVGPLIQRTGFHRNIIYRALFDLIEKQLVYKLSKHGVAYFEPIDPTPLLHEQVRKQELVKEVIEELQKKTHVSESEILILKGEQGIKDLTNLILSENSDLYYLGANGMLVKRYPRMCREFLDRMAKKGLMSYYLAQEEARDIIPAFDTLGKIQFLPQLSSSPIVIWMFGNYVANVLWEENETIFVTKNKKIADDYRKYFHLLWSQDIKIEKGFDAFKRAFFNMIESLTQGEQYHVLGANFGVSANSDGETSKKIVDIFSEVHQFRQKKGVKARLLFYQGLEDFVKQYKNFYKNAQIKYLPQHVTYPVQINIYKDTVFITIQDKKEPIIITLKSKQIANTFLEHFETLWNQEVKTYIGWQAIEKLFLDELVGLQDKDSVEYVMNASYGGSRDVKTNTHAMRFFEKYNRLRFQKGSKKEILFFEQHRARAKEEMTKAGDPKFTLIKIKFLPKEYYSPMQVTIVAGLAIVLFFGSNGPIATVYERPEIVKSFKKQFDLLWSIGRT